MTLNEKLTLAAIIIGPVVAVTITLVIEGVRRKREGRLQIMRMLLSTRHMPADPQYNTAINLIPTVFSDDKSIMDAWRKYHALVRESPDRPGHDKQVDVVQSQLIHHIMRSVGLPGMSEGDIQTGAYISQGFVDRDTFYINFLRAMPEIAAAMKRQNELTAAMFDAVLRNAAQPTGAGKPPIEHRP